ncbi:DUF3649 domain-containing protein [Stenotrophomonas sp. 24(2023)]|uniref:DUF3649 domain-containing protein n=1 Tax=Stenotrophomonas sp. 24(2023) TaxID=3068324 RepID=UPI0027DF018B|nr:DUF3649 domain-containing protein [Stenotrophomonas sp. 24(2023)]WMJ68420.1 DUF3649 domain-containing protein [Stenotrophomonas sp. 24(2023)]
MAASPSRPSAGAAPAKPVPRGNGHGLLWARGGLALLGGYAVAALWAAALARLLPGATADATLVATMASFVVYTLAAIWAFAARSTWRATSGLLLAGAVAALLACLLHGVPA